MSPLIPIEPDREDASRRRSMLPEAEADLEEDFAPDLAGAMAFVGIESRTRLTTSFGDVPAHLLRVNDTLRTSDRRYVKIRRIDVLKLDRDFLAFHPDALPIRIAAGAIAAGLPQRDLYLAPDQPLLCGSNSFGMKPAKARDMLSRPRVYREPGETVSYFRLTLDEDATVFAEKAQLRIEKPLGDV